ncbi:hypothetical protein NB688_003849 [Xanthomonas sacchari]|nr:hypothetical protein [Xanthomonas sacchari]
MPCIADSLPSELRAASTLLIRSISGDFTRANAPILSVSSCEDAAWLSLAVSNWIDAAVTSTSLAATTLLALCV